MCKFVCRTQYKGQDAFDVAMTLNSFLTKTKGLKTVACASLSLKEVIDVKRAIWGGRDARLEAIYQETEDGRRLGTCVKLVNLEIVRLTPLST